jgi:hypothetical protein
MKKLLLLAAVVSTMMSIGAFAQCATFPCVVATTTLVHQTHAISPTVVYTPTAEGTFRISVYTSATNGGTGQGQWDIVFRWVDRLGGKNSGLGAFRQIANSANIVVHDMAGQPLEYRTFASPERSQAPRAYDLYIVVEQLQ